jgi:hypothetical protein
MVAAVLDMDGQDEGLVPRVEPVGPVFTGFPTPVWTPDWALELTTPHAANAEPDAPIAAVAIIAASTVALQTAGNLEALVRIGAS